MPLANCSRCHGSGTVTLWKAPPYYVEDGDGPMSVPEQPYTDCPDCHGTGKAVPQK